MELTSSSGLQRMRAAVSMGGRILVLAALWLALPAPAWADERDDARRHFVAASEAYKAGDYALALEEFEAAQDILPHPNNLFNMARTTEKLGDVAAALIYYRSYAAQAPEDAERVTEAIARLEALLAAAEIAAEPAATVAAPVASATAEEIERLRAIAAELEALGAALAERDAAIAEGGTVDAGPGDEPPAVDDLDGELALADETYKREVVTASRYGQSPLDSPSTISILTAQDIRLSGATNFGDLMRRVVGVDVMFLSASQPDVAVRGFNKEFSNKVLVLIDGRSVYQDHLGAPLWPALPIVLEEVERIEIIRGPGAAIYGANAVTGVINIITRTPGEERNVVTVEAGSPGYARTTAVLSGRQGANRYRASAGYTQTGRWSSELDAEAQDARVDWVEDENHAMETIRAHMRLDRAAFGDGFASASAGYAGGFTEFYAIGTLGDFYLDYDAIFFRGDLSKGPVQFRLYHNGLDAQVGPWTNVVGSRGEAELNDHLDLDTLDAELDAEANFETGPLTHRLTGGIGYRLRTVAWEGYLSNPYEGAEPDDRIYENHVNAFIQDEASAERVRVVGSLRLDKHPLVPLNETVSPRGAMIVRVAPATSLRVSGGTAFRSPSALENYVDLNQPSSVDGVYVETLGDTELLPERVLTVEIGAHDESSDLHQADVALYVNQLERLINLRAAEPGIGGYQPEYDGFSAGNTGFVNEDASYVAYGAELEGRLFPVDGVDVYANATFQSTSRTTTDPESGELVTEPDRATSTVKVNAGAMYRSPWRIDLSTHASYLSEQEWRLRAFDAQGQIVEVVEALPARVIIASRLAARPFPEEALELSLSAWNLGALIGDTRFREHPKGQLIGGRLHGGVSYQF